MRLFSLNMTVRRAITAAFAALILCVISKSSANAHPLPTGRGDWRIVCQDGFLIPHFLGTYGDAFAQCAEHGGLKFAFDNGLVVFGFKPAFLKIPKEGSADGRFAAATFVLATKEGLVGEPQGYIIPTARNSWRIVCQDNMTVIDPFLGSYAMALQQCVGYGGVKMIFDNGLIVHGFTPVMRALPRKPLDETTVDGVGTGVPVAIVYGGTLPK